MNVRLIGEIGQNHQGSVEVAKDLVRICARPQRPDGDDDIGAVGGVDYIKLTKRDLSAELTVDAAATAYTGDNSFGATYGEHRRRLELTAEEHAEVFRYARSLGLGCVETVCAPGALADVLRHTEPDYLKVASRDLTNEPLLEAIAEAAIPVILSTGMAGRDELDNALEIITAQHDHITIMHCVSAYPMPAEEATLRTIQWLRREYPSYRIGWSCHAIGTYASTLAVALGAEVIEKHVTLDRQMRGGDHAGALDRGGIYRWVRDTRLAERALRGPEAMAVSPAAHTARAKLTRSIAYASDLPAGHRLRERDLVPLSPGTGYPWTLVPTVVGAALMHDVRRHTLVGPADLATDLA